MAKLGAHVAPLGMKFYTGSSFPAEYKNNIFIAEHGSWNRHKYQGAASSGWWSIRTARTPRWRPSPPAGSRATATIPPAADILVAPDGSLLVADDWAGAIYRIAYTK